MLTRTLPVIGNWYENKDTGTMFEVVAMDDAGLIATQYFDGEIEELDTETFLKMPLRAAEQPEDWGGPFEVDSEDRFESDFFAQQEEHSSEPGLEPEYMRYVDQ
ncbi:hypothetical protein A9Q99_20690 [Gammaproteobacteria bacterium 45_16_T64]|nr:hypothetical protein A9Q99_20690 [Gammaproteobacteria bacterium 45_16_T64]